MVWQVEKRGRRSWLVGSPHFFPYRFRGALGRLIAASQTVLLEGPLDERSMRRVVDAGLGVVHASLYHVLDPAARERICWYLGLAPALDAHALYRTMLFGRPDRWLEEELRRLKPWMAFFGVWTRYRQNAGDIHSLELEAQRTAARLGKELHHLESIEEQIAALDAIPLERIVQFVAHADWHAYRREHVRRYLDGDIEGLMCATRAFPSYCDAVIEQRDPVLAERMLPALERGGACAVIGVMHCAGVLAALRDAGFESRQRSGTDERS